MKHSTRVNVPGTQESTEKWNLNNKHFRLDRAAILNYSFPTAWAYKLLKIVSKNSDHTHPEHNFCPNPSISNAPINKYRWPDMSESVPKHLKACPTFFYRRNKNTLLPFRPEYKTDHFFLVGAGTWRVHGDRYRRFFVLAHIPRARETLLLYPKHPSDTFLHDGGFLNSRNHTYAAPSRFWATRVGRHRKILDQVVCANT